MEYLISRAAIELSIRSEVEMTMRSMLHDVEHAYYLEMSLLSLTELRLCESKLASLQIRYDDLLATRTSETRENERLGNVLLGELIDLSARMLDKDCRDVELGERLRLLEEEKGEEEKRSFADAKIIRAGVDDGDGGRAEIIDVGATADDDDDDDIPEDRSEGIITETGDGTMADDEIDISECVAEKEGGHASPSEFTNATATNVAASPTNDNDDGPNDAFVPHALDETTLMGIFAYLDPMEIMNFAQTNKALLSKVNVMFGMCGGGGGDDNGDDGGGEEREASEHDAHDNQQRNKRAISTSEGDSTDDDAVVVDDDPRHLGGDGEEREERARQLESMGFDAQRARLALDAAGGDVVRAAELLLLDDLPPSNDAPRDSIAGHHGGMTTASLSPPPMATVPTILPPTQSSSSSEGGTRGTTPSSSTTAKSSPKLFGMPGPSHHRRQGSSTSVATAGGGGNPFSQVSSWFGGAGIDASSVSSAPMAASIPISTNISSSTLPDTGIEIKLNAAMANSMASKLTPAELSVILRMREKLHKCEADAIKWRLEKEDAEANLASVEAVKEFLVTRVRDTERVVQAQKEEMRAVQRKSLEDQEVIVFLDERVKGLEKVVEEMKSKEATIKKESLDIVNKNEKKSRVLSDMLRFEREQIALNEKEWKSAKKLLVREVRSCRARIVALEAEIEGCSQQNALLKRGLLALQSSGSTSPGKKKQCKHGSYE
jgi:hypothetical protein